MNWDIIACMTESVYKTVPSYAIGHSGMFFFFLYSYLVNFDYIFFEIKEFREHLESGIFSMFENNEHKNKCKSAAKL